MTTRIQVLTEISPVAAIAVRAARNRHIWGRWATLQYARKRNIPHSLLTTAIVLANAERAGISL